eukprot:GFYU01001662.1.p1 GENE.GFYU01001662.1~~GFYU01001662.1.p1  ORF type:complete len:650 (+),score=163.12 GFYU01001662.1:100-2049(+)
MRSHTLTLTLIAVALLLNNTPTAAAAATATHITDTPPACSLYLDARAPQADTHTGLKDDPYHSFLELFAGVNKGSGEKDAVICVQVGLDYRVRVENATTLELESSKLTGSLTLRGIVDSGNPVAHPVQMNTTSLSLPAVSTLTLMDLVIQDSQTILIKALTSDPLPSVYIRRVGCSVVVSPALDEFNVDNDNLVLSPEETEYACMEPVTKSVLLNAIDASMVGLELGDMYMENCQSCSMDAMSGSSSARVTNSGVRSIHLRKASGLVTMKNCTLEGSLWLTGEGVMMDTITMNGHAAHIESMSVSLKNINSDGHQTKSDGSTLISITPSRAHMSDKMVVTIENVNVKNFRGDQVMSVMRFDPEDNDSTLSMKNVNVGDNNLVSKYNPSNPTAIEVSGAWHMSVENCVTGCNTLTSTDSDTGVTTTRNIPFMFLPTSRTSPSSSLALKLAPGIRFDGDDKCKVTCENPSVQVSYNNAFQCMGCPGGYGPATNSSMCAMCAPGYSSFNEASGCELCDVGSATNVTGAKQCDLCSLQDKYADKKGMTACLTCPDNTVEDGGKSCQQCDAGQGVTSLDNGHRMCMVCDVFMTAEPGHPCTFDYTLLFIIVGSIGGACLLFGVGWLVWTRHILPQQERERQARAGLLDNAESTN